MNGTWYFIEACDVWMFRDGRPFAAGESHLIQSLYPPSALTVQGALRSLVLYAQGVDPHSLSERTPHPQVGWGNDLGKFAMEGPYLAYWDRPSGAKQRPDSDKVVQCVPLPADLSYTKHGTYTRLQPGEAQGVTNFPDEDTLALKSNEELDDPPDQAWLGINTFKAQYLQGHIPPSTEIRYSPRFFEEEPRFGIGMDRLKRRPVDSMLYRAAFKRPKPDTGLLVKVSAAVGLPQTTTTFSIGGEGRSARIFPLDAKQVESTDDLSLPTTSGKVKVVLLTPAYFSTQQPGHAPHSTWKPLSGWSKFFGGEVAALRAAILPHFQTVGGWDMQHKRSRPLVRLVPAGTVFYFDCSVVPTSALTETPDGFPDFEKLGYGQFVVGSW